jgi:hypothetical protein
MDAFDRIDELSNNDVTGDDYNDRHQTIGGNRGTISAERFNCSCNLRHQLTVLQRRSSTTYPIHGVVQRIPHNTSHRQFMALNGEYRP